MSAGPTTEKRAECTVRCLGRLPYQEAWELQTSVAASRSEGRISDTLLLLEHPHTYTLGRRGDPSNILLSPSELEQLGVQVFNIDRGGDVTYHGPGQLVGYPILAVDEGQRDVIRYVRNLEEVLIRTLRDFSIEAGRLDGFSGVWIGEEKIAAIGVKVGRVTTHGFALNVNPDLSYFGHIIPCGIRDKGVTSMAQRLSADGLPKPVKNPSVEGVIEALVAHFGEVFHRRIVLRPEPPEVGHLGPVGSFDLEREVEGPISPST